MTTMPQQPIESVQVPQTVGLSPEVAFNLVGQAGLAPMFQAQQVAGRPLPGIATQWGQAPASFAGQAPLPGQPATQVIAQSPVAGSWVPRGSVVYMEWAEVAAAPPKKSPVGWIIAAVVLGLLALAGLFWWLTSGGEPEPDTSKSPTPTETVTESASPRPTRTVTETATATATATQTATATATATETETASPLPTSP
ncbi:MAG: hypothetical protein H6526_03295 [Actinobacteria bacterium]|nr:hypothetical protein [Actinomycetota bacterium]MCB8997820.1 hypothetical protein [Actinomycetota bacterium]MCB9414286.1 hypothetical protein [Actinomycetota bacterium]MCB9424031.1 hypothetical protein [Actinomycetota bacterium]HRY09238.1 hypothetical protein [Candidatus Nanopelagicales bacterium]